MSNEFRIRNGFFSEGNSNITGSLTVTGGITGSFSGSGTVTSASFALTASHVTPLIQDVQLTGSLDVTENVSLSTLTFTGSLASGSNNLYFSPSYDVRNWYLTEKNFAVSTQDATPNGLYFKDDGTRFYIAGSTNDRIYQYDVSTPWDVSTAVFNNVSASIAAQDTAPTDLFISPDGTILFMLGDTNDRVYRYNLTTPWDISAITFINFYSVAAEEATPNGLYFDPTGTKMYVVGTTGDDVNQYALGTPWDLTTVSFVQSSSVSPFETSPTAISFNADGSRMYIVGTAGDDISEFRLTIPWDVSTSTFYTTGFTFVTEVTPGGLYFNQTEQVAYVVGTALDTIIGLKTNPQVKYFGNSFVADGQMFVGGRFETSGDIYSNGSLTSVAGMNSLSTFTAPLGVSFSTSTTTLSNTTSGTTINIGTGATTALASQSLNISTGGAAGSQKIVRMANSLLGTLNNITIGSGSLNGGLTLLTSSAAEIYSLGSLYNYRNLKVGNNLVGDYEAPTGNIVFYDTFTEAVTTELTLHTPNTGSGWSRIFSGSTSATISARGGLNQSGPTTTLANVGVLYTASAALSTADYEVKFTMAVQTNSDDNIWLAARIQDFNNFYAVKWSATFGNCILYKKVAGTWTALATAGYAYQGTNIDLALRITGNQIYVINNGRLIISVTDSSITAAGQAGYGGGNLGAVSTDDLSSVWEIKNFTVTEYLPAVSYIEKGNFGIGTTNPSTNLDISGSARITNNLNVTGGITGSLLGTASFATSASFASTASFATSASWAPVTPPFPFTGSAQITGSLGVTGSISASALQIANELNGLLISTPGNLSNICIRTSTNPGISAIGKNIAFGQFALNSNTSGSNNVAFGYCALNSNTSGSNNVAFGQNALRLNRTGSSNIAIGNSALCTNSGSNNIAFGSSSLQSNTSGYSNFAAGYNTLQNNTTGFQNTAINFRSLRCNTTGFRNIAIGQYSLFRNTTGTGNIALGPDALGRCNTTGGGNVAIGRYALNYSGNNNGQVAIGDNALRCNFGGSRNVAIGACTGVGIIQQTLTANTFIGTYAGQGNGIGGPIQDNVAIGYNAGKCLGGFCTYVGYPVYNYVTVGSYRNTFIGTNAGRNSRPTSQYSPSCDNTAVGYSALSCNTSGINNTAIGARALRSNTYGSYNVAIGLCSLRSNTTGNNNTAVGSTTLYSNTTGQDNIAIGRNALRNNTTGQQNTAIGTSTLRYNTTGSSNIALGYAALRCNTSGSSNIALGVRALCANTATTGSHNIGIGYNTQFTGSFSVILGKDACSTGNSQFVIGSTGTPLGTVTTEACTSTKTWQIRINGTLQKILLA